LGLFSVALSQHGKITNTERSPSLLKLLGKLSRIASKILGRNLTMVANTLIPAVFLARLLNMLTILMDMAGFMVRFVIFNREGHVGMSVDSRGGCQVGGGGLTALVSVEEVEESEHWYESRVHEF